MKKTYIVAVLMLQGIRKKPFESGDVVVPENFPAGQFETLIEKGYIAEKAETAEEKAKREAKEAKSSKDSADEKKK